MYTYYETFEILKLRTCAIASLSACDITSLHAEPWNRNKRICNVSETYMLVFSISKMRAAPCCAYTAKLSEKGHSQGRGNVKVVLALSQVSGGHCLIRNLFRPD